MKTKKIFSSILCVFFSVAMIAQENNEVLVRGNLIDIKRIYEGVPFFHGFQYADWVFDGDDIAAVVRVGAPESRGLPSRQHDSNMMTFVRIKNFRNL